MYVLTVNILWSVVYITSYKEKDKQLNWTHKYNLHHLFSGTDWQELAEKTEGEAE
jgi:hypothetical protein